MGTTKRKPIKRLVPMVPVKCPICKGEGKVISKVIKTFVPCRGCKGTGWVEVHKAYPVPAPKVVPTNPNFPKGAYPSPVPNDWNAGSGPWIAPWKDPDGAYTITNDSGTGAGGGGSNSVDIMEKKLANMASSKTTYKAE